MIASVSVKTKSNQALQPPASSVRTWSLDLSSAVEHQRYGSVIVLHSTCFCLVVYEIIPLWRFNSTLRGPC